MLLARPIADGPRTGGGTRPWGPRAGQLRFLRKKSPPENPRDFSVERKRPGRSDEDDAVAWWFTPVDCEGGLIDQMIHAIGNRPSSFGECPSSCVGCGDAPSGQCSEWNSKWRGPMGDGDLQRREKRFRKSKKSHWGVHFEAETPGDCPHKKAQSSMLSMRGMMNGVATLRRPLNHPGTAG
jgi:hypothetical protein